MNKQQLIDKWTKAGMLEGLSPIETDILVEYQLLSLIDIFGISSFPSLFLTSYKMAKHWAALGLELDRYEIEENRVMF